MVKPDYRRLLPPKATIELVVWLDAKADCGDRASAIGAEAAVNVSVGWPIDESAERLVLAYEASTTGEEEHIVILSPNIIASIGNLKKDILETKNLRTMCAGFLRVRCSRQAVRYSPRLPSR